MTVTYNILIVDDVSENIKVAINILKNDDYNFSYALNGEEAIEILKMKRFDLVLLDIMMPGIDGYQVCKLIKNTPAIKETPIIFLTAKVDIDSIEKGFSLGAVDYVTKPFHPIELKVRVRNHVELYRAKKQLNKHNINLLAEIEGNNKLHFTELELAQKEIIYILTELMETRSGETASHVKRVANISKLLAQLDGRMDQEELKIIFLVSPLHDIGKILVDNNILHKAGPLNDKEFLAMKQHPVYANNILNKSQTKLIKIAALVAYEHHENYDGSGYPQGLVGDDISLFGRVVAIADVLDALTHKRVYKEAWSFEKASEFIVENSGIKFEPRLIKTFTDNAESFKKIIAEI